MNCTEVNFEIYAAPTNRAINREASTYITENYYQILRNIRSFPGVEPSKAGDLLQDVFISIYRSEENGDGFDMAYNGSNMTVENYVYGRIKGYAKNDRYHSAFSERNNKCSEERKVEIMSASISTEEDMEHMNSFQKAYANAASDNCDLDNCELQASLRSNIEFCRGFSELVGFDMLNLFKNLDLFSSNFDTSLFDKLRRVAAMHDQFAEALRDCLEAAKSDRYSYNQILAAIA